MHADAAALLARVVAEAWAPDPAMTPSQWADARRMLSPKASAEHGPWRTSRTPYLREPMDAAGPDSGIQDHVWVFASQTGKSEGLNNLFGHRMDVAPCPALLIQPTLDLAKRYSKMRVAPMIESTPTLAAKVKPSRSRDSGNTLLMKEFLNQALLIMGGANAASGLASMPILLAGQDEVDRFPLDVDGEGSPGDLVDVRTRTFGKRARRIKTSTPTLADRSVIWSKFEESDQRQYHLPCPHCQQMQVLAWDKLRWNPSDPLLSKGRLSQPPVMICEACGEGIEERYKSWWYGEDLGRWIPQQPDSPIRGYHLPGFYSPLGWLSWEEIVLAYERAKDAPERLKVWTNTVLALPWAEQGEVPEWEALYRRREGYPIGTVPPGGLVLTAGVDVQRDRLELEVVAWGPRMESWSVDYVVIHGDTSTIQEDPAKPCPWRVLGEQLARVFPTTWGGEMRLSRMAVDSGDQTQTVYAWIRSQRDHRLMATKGRDQLQTIVGMPTMQEVTARGRKLKRGIQLWPLGVSVAKHELYGWLRAAPPLNPGDAVARGFCHFPMHGEGWFQGLTAEELKRKVVRGFPRYYWEKVRARNEPLDCRVMARGALAALGADRWTEAKWEKLRASVAPEQPHVAAVTANPEQQQPQVQQPVAGQRQPRRRQRPVASGPSFVSGW
jgi:phage terminase large subunit GpA-like protein